MTQKWIDENLPKLKALKKPSKQQKLLIELAERKDAKDAATLHALVVAEKAAQRAEAARIKAASVLKDSTKKKGEEERKARNHRLIKQGLLFDYLGLDARPRAELLGMLMYAARMGTPEVAQQWRAEGAALLAQKEPAPAPATAQKVVMLDEFTPDPFAV